MIPGCPESLLWGSMELFLTLGPHEPSEGSQVEAEPFAGTHVWAWGNGG